MAEAVSEVASTAEGLPEAVFTAEAEVVSTAVAPAETGSVTVVSAEAGFMTEVSAEEGSATGMFSSDPISSSVPRFMTPGGALTRMAITAHTAMHPTVRPARLKLKSQPKTHKSMWTAAMQAR